MVESEWRKAIENVKKWVIDYVILQKIDPLEKRLDETIPDGELMKIKERMDQIEKKGDFKTENCPHYVTGCFHVLEERKIIENLKPELAKVDNDYYLRIRDSTTILKEGLIKIEEIENFQRDYANIKSQRDEFHAKWVERTADAKCYMERCQEALKVYEDFLESYEEPDVCVSKMVKALKKV